MQAVTGHHSEEDNHFGIECCHLTGENNVPVHSLKAVSLGSADKCNISTDKNDLSISEQHLAAEIHDDSRIDGS